MKRLALLLLMLLTACVGADPYSQIAAGQAALQATAVARNAAAEATRGAINAMQYEQTQLAGQALAIQAQIKGTQEAIAYQQTAISLQDTQAASALQSTQSAATASALTLQSTIDAGLRSSHYYATQTAIPFVASMAISRQRRLNAVGWAGAGLLIGVICLLLLFGLAMVHVLWLRGKAQAAFIAERARYLSTREIQQLPAAAGPPAENPRQDVINFLSTAAGVVGRDSSRLPRYDDMPGYDSTRWTHITDYLARAGALVKISGQGRNNGSFIRTPYKTINGLYQAVMSNALPYPTGGDD